jgi:hypothetical protein
MKMGTTLEWIIALSSLLIALAFGGLAWFVVRRVKIPKLPTYRHPFTLFAGAALIVLFLGSLLTHLVLSWNAVQGTLEPSWVQWWTVGMLLAKAIAGIAFWFIAVRHLQVNIFDKEHYDEMTKTQREGELETQFDKLEEDFITLGNVIRELKKK